MPEDQDLRNPPLRILEQRIARQILQDVGGKSRPALMSLVSKKIGGSPSPKFYLHSRGMN